jgi:hypothetical protein
MDDRPSSTFWLAAALLVLAPCTYPASYLLLGERRDSTDIYARVTQRARIFPNETLANAYGPLGKLESAMTGIEVNLFYRLHDDVGPAIVVGLDPLGQETSNRELNFGCYPAVIPDDDNAGLAQQP